MLTENHKLMDRISVNPEICGGRACIKNTRIRVSDIIEMLADGAEFNDILEDYPMITREDINAAMKFAAASLNHKTLNAA